MFNVVEMPATRWHDCITFIVHVQYYCVHMYMYMYNCICVCIQVCQKVLVFCDVTQALSAIQSYSVYSDVLLIMNVIFMYCFMNMQQRNHHKYMHMNITSSDCNFNQWVCTRFRSERYDFPSHVPTQELTSKFDRLEDVSSNACVHLEYMCAYLKLKNLFMYEWQFLNSD